MKMDNGSIMVEFSYKKSNLWLLHCQQGCCQVPLMKGKKSLFKNGSVTTEYSHTHNEIAC